MAAVVALALSVLGGPLAFFLARAAGGVLLTGSCAVHRSPGTALGLSGDQWLMVAITLVCTLVAAAGAGIGWRIWQLTRDQVEARTGESLRAIPFWAMGGMFLSALFGLGILLSGILAVELSSPCA